MATYFGIQAARKRKEPTVLSSSSQYQKCTCDFLTCHFLKQLSQSSTRPKAKKKVLQKRWAAKTPKTSVLIFHITQRGYNLQQIRFRLGCFSEISKTRDIRTSGHLPSQKARLGCSIPTSSLRQHVGRSQVVGHPPAVAVLRAEQWSITPGFNRLRNAKVPALSPVHWIYSPIMCIYIYMFSYIVF